MIINTNSLNSNKCVPITSLSNHFVLKVTLLNNIVGAGKWRVLGTIPMSDKKMEVSKRAPSISLVHC